jgi:cystathionine beta-lyase/cystathionine gamma-synthase
LAITHNTDSIFEYKSALLKPGALNEMKRTAHMIRLYPNKAIHIEISLDPRRFLANNHLYGSRIQVIKKIMLQHGIDVGHIQTTTQRAVSAMTAKDTISVKVMDSPVEPLACVGHRLQQADGACCQAYPKRQHYPDRLEGLSA